MQIPDLGFSVLLVFCCYFGFELGPPVSQAVYKLTMKPRMTLSSRAACPSPKC